MISKSYKQLKSNAASNIDYAARIRDQADHVLIAEEEREKLRRSKL